MLGVEHTLADGPCSLELISQNQPVIQQCFSLTTNQHQHQLQPQKRLAEPLQQPPNGQEDTAELILNGVT
jgi:hypothetical protein